MWATHHPPLVFKNITPSEITDIIVNIINKSLGTVCHLLLQGHSHRAKRK